MSQNTNPNEPNDRNNFDLRRHRGLFIWLAIGAGILLMVTLASKAPPGTIDNLTYSELTKAIREGRVESLVVNKGDYTISGEFRTEGTSPDQPQRFTSEVQQDVVPALNTLISEHAPDVELRFKQPSVWIEVLRTLLPVLLVVFLIYFFFFRQIRSSAGGGVLNFGKSRATRITRDKVKKTFADVAGIDEACEEVSEIIEFLRDPDRFRRLGGRLPKGCLLIGSPGTGKTLLAKAIAGEADVPFFSISGSDFVEMFVGVGASRVRDLFEQAKENAPCIIFLDEVDAVGRRRGTGWSGGHDEREQTLNAILVEMDGFSSNENVIVIAATNRPDVLDPALLRPGRFDRRIYVELPDLRGREEILKVHAREIRLAEGTDLRRLARGTPGFSGADLENVINEGALLAAMKGKDEVVGEDLEEARDKVRWGREKRSRIPTDEDRRVTATHEAGHALVNQLLKDVSPLHKVTIVRRGPAIGATMQLPEKDEEHLTRRRVIGDVKLLLAGRAAEKAFCDDVTTGAANDLERATSLVRSMICEWGMSDAMGLVHYGEPRTARRLFADESPSEGGFSEATAERIDAEVRRTMDEAYAETERIVDEHRRELSAIRDALLEFEVLTAEEVQSILQGADLAQLRVRRRSAGRSQPASAEEKQPADESAPAAGQPSPGEAPPDHPPPLPQGA